MTARVPFQYSKTSPEVICLEVMRDARFPLSLRNVEGLLDERDIDVSHETVRFWRHRFSSRPLFKAKRTTALAEWRGLCTG